jgi:polyvinyl alcohol dehydrogenase (cytochrome)
MGLLRAWRQPRAGAGRASTRMAFTLSVVAAALAFMASAAAAVPGTETFTTGQWPVAGQNLHNTHFNAAEHQISPANASTLAPKWVLTTAGNVTATPTVADGVVYVPDLGGKLWAVNASSGAVLWSHTIASYTGITGDVSRTSPAVYGDELIMGDGYIGNSVVAPAHVFAVNRFTGRLLWSTQVDSFPGSIITSSPVVHAGVAYLGIASKEEALATRPGYQCCVFRGAVVALNAATGTMLWKTYTIPSDNGNGDANLPGYYAGGAVWGSSPVVDTRRGFLYIGVGNLYTAPAGVCTMPGQTGCTPSATDAYFDSILALRLSDGAIAWADHTVSSDVFTGACFAPGAAACGPDWDFGSAPNLFATTNPATGQPEQLLGIGQKSGIYWALNPANGTLVWETRVGPGGVDGGIEWGSATDGTRIYVAEADSLHQPYTLGGSGPFAGQTIAYGSWAALDAATGKILWQIPDPQGAPDIGFVSAANGVVYVGSMLGNMYALDARTGAILWRFASGGSVAAGASIVGRAVYWGSGYSFSPTACPSGGCGPNNKLYAFTPSR